MRDAAAIRDALAKAGVSGTDVAETSLGTVCRVGLPAAIESLAALADAGFDSLIALHGADTGEAVEVTYHLRAYDDLSEAFVKTDLAYDGELPSAWNIYPSALMSERETAELFGLRLAGHPNPKRLLTTEGVEPLLRKSVPIRTPEEVRLR